MILAQNFCFAQHTESEAEIMALTNLVRTDPLKFRDSLLIPYATEHKLEGKYYKSLLRDLSRQQPLNILSYKNDLHMEAFKHADDMGKAGKASHNSSKGISYEKRTLHLMKTYNIVGENCQYGYNNPLEIVIDLLIDEGIANLGHRKAILSPNFNSVGISIQPHKKYEWNTVMEFGGNVPRTRTKP